MYSAGMRNQPRYKYVNLGRDRGYEVVDTTTDEVVETALEHPYAIVTRLNNEEFKKADRHMAHTGISRTGGSMIAGGGNWRESEAYCSCGWRETANGQTYAESVQEIRDHLKEMEVYTTPLEQKVYAHIRSEGSSTQEISDASGVSLGRVNKALAKFLVRGNVAAYIADEELRYEKTDKWFSWND